VSDVVVAVGPLLFWGVVFGGIGHLIGSRRGMRPVKGILIGILLGPIGWILLAVIPTSEQEQERWNREQGRKRCPQCAEWVQRSAKVCRHCGYAGRTATPEARM
jgi:hypothetical protein